MKVLDAPKTKKALPKYMTLEEARHLLSVVDGKHKERDYAILTLLLNCGMRLSELVSIDYNDIKSNDTLVITGKGNKERTVYLNDACKAMKTWVLRKSIPTSATTQQRPPLRPIPLPISMGLNRDHRTEQTGQPCIT